MEKKILKVKWSGSESVKSKLKQLGCINSDFSIARSKQPGRECYQLRFVLEVAIFCPNFSKE